MNILQTRVLRGPNLWSLHTVIQAVVRCAGAELCLDQLPGFESRLRERFPQIGPFAPDVTMVSALELAALGLQAQAGCRVAFSRSVATIEAGVYQVVVEYTEEVVGRLAIELALELCTAAAATINRSTCRAPLGRLQELDEEVRLGPEHRLDRGGRRGPRHPLPAAHRGQPGAIRLGQQAAAHPGGGDGQHQHDRRGDRPGQGTDEVFVRSGRGAGAQGPPGQGRRGRVGRGLRDRRPGGGEAARRQPGPGSGGPHRVPRAGHGRLRRRARG